MKRKKSIAVILAAVMTLSLSACGSAGETADVPASSVKEETWEESSVQESEPEQEMEEESSEESTEKTAQPKAFDTSATIAETVLLDENNVKITATGLEYDDYEVTLNLTIENNSDKDLSFISGSIGYSCNAVNGFMMNGGYLNADVAAGKKSNEAVEFSLNELRVMGITELADIQIGFDISDEDYNHTYSGARQVKTSLAESYDYGANPYQEVMSSGALAEVYGYTVDYYAEEELYNQNEIRLVSETVITNKDGEQVLFLELENHSEEMVYCATADIALNGLVVCSTTWTSDSINPGARRIVDISLEDLKEKAYGERLGLSEVGEFSCSLAVKDSEYEELIAPQEICVAIPGANAEFDKSGTEVYNENGIRIVSKGLAEDSSDSSEDMHMLLLVENTSADVIRIDTYYDSLSLNGFMTDFYSASAKVAPGKYALLDVRMKDDSLKANGISGLEDITDAEISFEIRTESYKEIATPKVAITY